MQEIQVKSRAKRVARLCVFEQYACFLLPFLRTWVEYFGVTVWSACFPEKKSKFLLSCQMAQLPKMKTLRVVQMMQDQNRQEGEWRIFPLISLINSSLHPVLWNSAVYEAVLSYRRTDNSVFIRQEGLYFCLGEEEHYPIRKIRAEYLECSL